MRELGPLRKSARDIRQEFPPKPDHWQPRFGRPISYWYRKFAWWPVRTLDREYVWLTFYWRRAIYKLPFLDGGSDSWFQNAYNIDLYDTDRKS